MVGLCPLGAEPLSKVWRESCLIEARELDEWYGYRQALNRGSYPGSGLHELRKEREHLISALKEHPIDEEQVQGQEDKLNGDDERVFSAEDHVVKYRFDLPDDDP